MKFKSLYTKSVGLPFLLIIYVHKKVIIFRSTFQNNYLVSTALKKDNNSILAWLTIVNHQDNMCNMQANTYRRYTSDRCGLLCEVIVVMVYLFA